MASQLLNSGCMAIQASVSSSSMKPTKRMSPEHSVQKVGLAFSRTGCLLPIQQLASWKLAFAVGTSAAVLLLAVYDSLVPAALTSYPKALAGLHHTALGSSSSCCLDSRHAVIVGRIRFNWPSKHRRPCDRQGQLCSLAHSRPRQPCLAGLCTHTHLANDSEFVPH